MIWWLDIVALIVVYVLGHVRGYYVGKRMQRSLHNLYLLMKQNDVAPLTRNDMRRLGLEVETIEYVFKQQERAMSRLFADME